MCPVADTEGSLSVCRGSQDTTSSLNAMSQAANSQAWPFDYTRAEDKGNPKNLPHHYH